MSEAVVLETEGTPAHFSSVDIRRVAGIPDEAEGHSAGKVLCWFAARIRDFSSVELKIFYLPWLDAYPPHF
jgi:hypothetical protein